MERHYADMLDVQKRLRSLVESARLPVQLEPDPPHPGNVDQLAEALAVIRANMTLVQIHLNDWDFRVNGSESRPRAQIKADIDHDTRLLSRPDLRGGRSVEEINRNIAYDQMQLSRN